MMEIRPLIFSLVFILFIVGFAFFISGQEGTPPVISNIKVLEITTSSAVISWVTDKRADSIVNYGLDRNYGVVRDPTFTTEHQVVLDNLLPNTDYYFQVVSVDENGNQAALKGFTFTTKKLVEIPGS
jgi:chitodextrinase